MLPTYWTYWVRRHLQGHHAICRPPFWLYQPIMEFGLAAVYPGVGGVSGRDSINEPRNILNFFRVFWWLTSLGSRFHCFSAEFHRNKASKSVCQMFAESRIYLLQRRTQRILYGESCAHNARRVTWLIRYQVVHDDVPIGSLKKFRNFFFSLV